MKKYILYYLITIFTLINIFPQHVFAQPHLHIERNFEALRLDGDQAWLSFYDGPAYEGFLWNNQGNITLGTTEFNPAGKLKFVTNLQERMIIDDQGRIGIGVVPQYKLDISGSESFTLLNINQTGIGRALTIQSIDADAIHAISSNSSAMEAYGATYGLYASASATGGVGVYGQSSQSVGVEGYSGSSASYDFYASGPGMNYGAASSRRWKNNIKNIDEPLKKIAALRGVYYTWDKAHGGQHDVGFIAEEVGKVLPEIVGYEENGIDAKGMDYSKMTPLLVEAINALQREYQETIFHLKNQIEVLENRMNAQVITLPSPASENHLKSANENK